MLSTKCEQWGLQAPNKNNNNNTQSHKSTGFQIQNGPRSENRRLVVHIVFLLRFLLTGTGTFGRVVLVQDRKTKGYFALKSMKIVDLIRLKQQQHVHNEKEVLMEVHHPFIVKL